MADTQVLRVQQCHCRYSQGQGKFDRKTVDQCIPDYCRLSQMPSSLMAGMPAPNAVHEPLHANHVPSIHSVHLIGPALAPLAGPQPNGHRGRVVVG